MRLKSSKLLFAYWDDLREGRIAPRRFEIEPSRIAEILPETFILEKVGRTGFRFRLAGTRVCDRLGAEFRGADFVGCWDLRDRPALSRNLQAVAEDGAVLVADVEATYSSHKRALFEFVVLPLVHTGNQIDRFLGVVSTEMPVDRISWGALKSLRLVKAKLRQPTVPMPDTPAEAGTNPGVFQPHVRNARIVRHDRRSFRVYEGGLSERRPGDDP